MGTAFPQPAPKTGVLVRQRVSSHVASARACSAANCLHGQPRGAASDALTGQQGRELPARYGTAECRGHIAPGQRLGRIAQSTKAPAV